MISDSATETFDVKAMLRAAPTQPGVYRMRDARGDIIYIGKAKQLRKRLASYFTRTGRDMKTRLMVARVAAVETTVTHTEGEALLLENNLIKAHKPRFNILLRDDKSYPSVYVSTDQPFPRIAVHRGARRGKGRYFGPYPNVGSVRQTLSLLQKVFQVRQCRDSFFANRTRPCLQYQIKRCTAPCVGLVSEVDYGRDVAQVLGFLEGRSQAVLNTLATEMEQASQALAFERAAGLRDRIVRLRRLCERQHIAGGSCDRDVVAVAREGGVTCIQVFYIRDGRNLGNNAFFPQAPGEAPASALLSAFVAQYYIDGNPPREIVLNAAPADRQALAEVLTRQAGRAVQLISCPRGDRAKQLELAVANAVQAVRARLSDTADMQRRYAALATLLGLDTAPARMECFDISHTMGEATVASCVVFDAHGPLKSDYRRFNIKDITPGDDYAAMRQALQRRYSRLRDAAATLPELVVIDGGKGQLRQARDVLEELGLDDLPLLAVAKGADRKAGLEQCFLNGAEQALALAPGSAALHLIQQIRDEAHRFAITGHRQRRAKARKGSLLDDIHGLGPQRRRQLLRVFGGVHEVAKASVAELRRIEGVSDTLAQRIVDHFHGDSASCNR